MDGFVNLNKPCGLSSHTAMARVRRLLATKAGHSGTLDPFANGVLPLCLGKCTRLAEYITELPKSYRGEIIFGIATNTYDKDGEITEQLSCDGLSQEIVTAALDQFRGTIMQVPPMVSALKFQGKPLYELARRGEEIAREPRRITVYNLQLIKADFNLDKPRIILDICCSKGTYIRSLADDLGKAAGCCAHLASLTRTMAGPFKLTEALSLEQIESMIEKNDLSFILPPSYGVSHLPVVTVKGEKTLFRVNHGNEIPLKNASDLPLCRVETSDNELLAIGQIMNGTLKIKKVLVTE